MIPNLIHEWKALLLSSLMVIRNRQIVTLIRHWIISKLRGEHLPKMAYTFLLVRVSPDDEAP